MSNRLVVYQAQTRPLVGFYNDWAATGDPEAPKVRRIAGSGAVEEIRDRTFAALTN